MTVALLVGGCGRTETDTATLPLRLLDGCDEPPGPIDRVELRALGDFPSDEQTIAILRPDTPEGRVEQLPGDTRLYAVDALSGPDWRAGGIRAARDADFTRPVVLLPLGRSCPLGDPEVRLPEGGAAAPLPDGGLLVAGGLEGETAVRRLVVLEGGSTLSELPGAGLELVRSGATATAVGDGRVLIAGGAPGRVGPAHDTWELFDAADRSVTLGDSKLSAPRRDHGATALPDGRVLLAGGVPRGGGEPLSSAELVDPREDSVEVLERALPSAVTSPQAVTLDDGTVLVMGGLAPDGLPHRAVHVLDLEGRRLARAAELPPLRADSGGEDAPPARVRAERAVPLPGARAAWVGRARDEEGETARTAVVVLRRAPPYDGSGATITAHEADVGLPALDHVRAAALRDGVLLVTGVEPSGSRRAFLVDPALERMRPSDSSRVPTGLVVLGDGAVVELTEAGASLRRESMRTAFDNPPATLLVGGAAEPLGEGRLGQEVAFDAPGRWTSGPQGLVALADDARVDVPALRFARFEVTELVVDEGDGDRLHAELLLVRDGAADVPVLVEPGRVSVEGCAIERVGGAPLRLTRRGNAVRLSAGGESVRCEPGMLGDRVGVAVRLAEGNVVRGLQIRRLE